MNSFATDNIIPRLTQALAEVAEIIAVYTSKNEILFKASPLIDTQFHHNEIISRFSQLGYRAEIIADQPTLVVRLKSLEIQSRQAFPWTPIVLFIATVITTLLTGALYEGLNLFSNPETLWQNPLLVISQGFPFSFSLLSILVVHEFGHYIAGRIHGVNMSLPYFIPAPPGITIIGTFGAVIKSRSAFINRKQLLDVGASGPLAGLIISIVVFAIGINGSPLREIPENVSGLMMVGDSLLNSLMVTLLKGPIPENQTLVFNSVAFAGWVGLLVTMLNLLPIGHLDGGHIVYALVGKKQRLVAGLILVGLLILSFYWAGWIFWIIFGIILRPAHPPTLLDEIPLGNGRIFVGYLSMAIFVLCFMPIPFAIT